MKILVFSDSHSSLSFMRMAMSAIRPDAVIHLGDYFDDGQCLSEDFPRTPLYQVPGNCDRYCLCPNRDEILSYPIGGVLFYMTHGHKHGVKSGTGRLLAAARASGAAIVLYGHTHRAECVQEADGLWILNPGSCRGFGGSAGLITLENGKITGCRLLEQADLEEYS